MTSVKKFKTLWQLREWEDLNDSPCLDDPSKFISYNDECGYYISLVDDPWEPTVSDIRCRLVFLLHEGDEFTFFASRDYGTNIVFDETQGEPYYLPIHDDANYVSLIDDKEYRSFASIAEMRAALDLPEDYGVEFHSRWISPVDVIYRFTVENGAPKFVLADQCK